LEEYIKSYALNSFCQVLRGRERERVEWGVREGVGAGGRIDPSLVCTYE
jgi:hypothetical protein